MDFGDNRYQPNPMNPNPRPPSYNNVLLRSENYHTIPNVEDRLFVPEQYVPLFVRYPKTQISPLFTVQGLQPGSQLTPNSCPNTYLHMPDPNHGGNQMRALFPLAAHALVRNQYAVNEMAQNGDGDTLILTRQHLLTIPGVISENLVKAGDLLAAKSENN